MTTSAYDQSRLRSFRGLLRANFDRRVSDRAVWLIGLRWLVLTAVAAIALVGNALLNLGLPVPSVLATLAGVAVYNLLFWAASRSHVLHDARIGVHAALLRAQILADLVALTTLLHFSGGIENPFSAHYMILVLVGSILMTRRDSFLFAWAASLLWTGLLLGEALGLLPHYNLVAFRLPFRYQEWGHIVAESAVITSAAFVISQLSSNVVIRLRESQRRLYETHRDSEARAAELVVLNERLQEMDRTRSQFIRLVTHELRAPVAAIQSYLRLIIEGYVPAGDVPDIIRKAELRANDQLELISDLLNLAHIRDAKAPAAAEACDMAQVLDDVLDMCHARFEGRSIGIHVSVEPGLPVAAINKEHAKQVWTNLVSNAVKYTNPGGDVTITLCCDDGILRGSVQDTGIGIAPEDQERVFDGFYRTDEAKSMAIHGTGLGLSIAKGILEACGGSIRLESELGHGSTFEFTLPAAAPDAASQA